MSEPLAPGFRASQRTSPFLEAALGPLYERPHESGLEIALLLEERHCNSRGLVHGGALSTIADVAMGRALLEEGRRPPTTVAVEIVFMQAVSANSWLHCLAMPLRRGARLAFVEANFTANGELVARATGTFSLG